MTFWSCIKAAWFQKFRNLWHHSLANKQLQYTYYPNISRSKGHQEMKFPQLIVYKMRNIFVEKSYIKCDGETVPRPFSKKKNWAYLCIKSLKFYAVCFYHMPSLDIYIIYNILKLSSRPIAFNSFKAFSKKTNRGRELVSLPHFLHDFWRRMFLLLYSINWPNFIVWLPLIREILGNMCTVIVC